MAYVHNEALTFRKFLSYTAISRLTTNAAVCLKIFIYKGPKMKLGSVGRADRAQSNDPVLRSLANFHIELE